jgi:diamine N-acetyltransferase
MESTGKVMMPQEERRSQEPTNERIIGYASWFFTYFTWSGKGIYLEDLYVQPAYRSSGIGRRLIETVMERGRASGCHLMRWQVADWNHRAIGFYESLGAIRDVVNRNCDLVL